MKTVFLLLKLAISGQDWRFSKLKYEKNVFDFGTLKLLHKKKVIKRISTEKSYLEPSLKVDYQKIFLPNDKLV